MIWRLRYALDRIAICLWLVQWVIEMDLCKSLNIFTEHTSPYGLDLLRPDNESGLLQEPCILSQIYSCARIKWCFTSFAFSFPSNAVGLQGAVSDSFYAAKDQDRFKASVRLWLNGGSIQGKSIMLPIPSMFANDGTSVEKGLGLNAKATRGRNFANTKSRQCLLFRHLLKYWGHQLIYAHPKACLSGSINSPIKPTITKSQCKSHSGQPKKERKRLWARRRPKATAQIAASPWENL